jgi:hypothetical protein
MLYRAKLSSSSFARAIARRMVWPFFSLASIAGMVVRLEFRAALCHLRIGSPQPAPRVACEFHIGAQRRFVGMGLVSGTVTGGVFPDRPGYRGRIGACTNRRSGERAPAAPHPRAAEQVLSPASVPRRSVDPAMYAQLPDNPAFATVFNRFPPVGDRQPAPVRDEDANLCSEAAQRHI